jgi:hypothetical protein
MVISIDYRVFIMLENKQREKYTIQYKKFLTPSITNYNMSWVF